MPIRARKGSVKVEQTPRDEATMEKDLNRVINSRARPQECREKFFACRASKLRRESLRTP